MKEKNLLGQIYQLNKTLDIFEKALVDISKFKEGQDAKLCALIAKSVLKEVYDVNSEIQKITSRR